VSSRVLVSLRVKASPERAFEAFVNEIGAWWQPNPLFTFTPRAIRACWRSSPARTGA